MPNDAPPVGVDDEDLAAVASELVSAPDMQSSRNERFFAQVQQIVESRAQTNWSGETGPAKVAIFVRAQYPRQSNSKIGGVPNADLVATSESILGRLFLLNADAAQGFAAPLPSDDPGQLIEWLSNQDFAHEPTILIYRDSLLMIERGQGATGEATRREAIRTEKPAASHDELLRGLSHFHYHETSTPSVCPKGVWKPKAAAKYHVGEEPERAIQYRLRTFLNGWFRTVVRAECEDQILVGRIDVRLLVPTDQNGLAYWSIVELKVIKSFRYSDGENPTSVSVAENAEAVAEGLRQAHQFCQDRSCPPGFLEVFDLRKDKSFDIGTHAIVVEQMTRLNPLPITHVRPLYGSAKEARDAGIAAGL